MVEVSSCRLRTSLITPAIVPESVRFRPEIDGMTLDESTVNAAPTVRLEVVPDMMNTVVGSAIGGLVAGAVALGAAAAMRPSPAPAYGPDPNANGAYAMTVANTAPFNNGASLQCQPHEEAVLRRAVVNGREVTDVTCITRSGAYAPQAMYAPQG